MPPPKNTSKTGGRLSGDDMCRYAEEFVSRFLSGRMRYNTHVVRVNRDEAGWALDIRGANSRDTKKLRYKKLVLCTGVRRPNAITNSAPNQIAF